MNKRLIVLSDDQDYNSAIFVYDIGKDVDKSIDKPYPLITYDF